MQHIGSIDEARDAYWMVIDGDIQDDWRVVGQGRSRLALLAPSHVLYKVPWSSSMDGSPVQESRREAAWMAHWAAQGVTCIPATCLYEVSVEYGDLVPVVAMEYIEADGSEPSNLGETLRLQAEAGILDINGANLVVRAGTAYIVDAGGV